MIKVKQLTPIYDEKEDRLRLIVNINFPNRYDLFITRRFLINILDNLQNFLIKNNIKSKEDSFNSSKNNDQNLNTIYPSINKKPILLESINITCLNENNFLINLLDEKDNKFEIMMSYEELNNLIELILKIVKFEWGINFL